MCTLIAQDIPQEVCITAYHNKYTHWHYLRKMTSGNKGRASLYQLYQFYSIPAHIKAEMLVVGWLTFFLSLLHLKRVVKETDNYRHHSYLGSEVRCHRSWSPQTNHESAPTIKGN